MTRTLLRPLMLLRDLAITALVVLLALPVWLLPWRMAAAVGRGYGKAMGLASPRRFRIGLINISRAYGRMLPPLEMRRIVWASMGSLGESLADGLQFARRFRKGQAGVQALYDCEDPGLEQRVLDDPRPKIFVTGHLGSWEIAGAIAGARAGDRGAAVVRRIENVFLDALARRLRMRHRDQWIDKQGATAVALARLRQGDSVALLLDENAGRRGTFVDFFGRKASTGRIAALLSLNTGAPIVVGACVRRASGRFLYRLALIEPSYLPTTAGVKATTQAIVATLERWVRDDPDQWRWAHARWKTRPGGTDESYGRRDLAACLAAQPSAGVSARQGTAA